MPNRKKEGIPELPLETATERDLCQLVFISSSQLAGWELMSDEDPSIFLIPFKFWTLLFRPF